MAYVVITKEDEELIFSTKPEFYEGEWREKDGDELVYDDYADFSAGIHWEDRFLYGIELPKGTIEKLVGKIPINTPTHV